VFTLVLYDASLVYFLELFLWATSGFSCAVAYWAAVHLLDCHSLRLSWAAREFFCVFFVFFFFFAFFDVTLCLFVLWFCVDYARFPTRGGERRRVGGGGVGGGGEVGGVGGGEWGGRRGGWWGGWGDVECWGGGGG